MNADELDLIRRVLALQKLKKMGALWVENWRFEICMGEFDAPEARVWISVTALRVMVEEIEATLRRPPVRAESNEDFSPKIPVYFKNNSGA